MESQLALNQGMPFFLDPAWMHSKDFACCSRRPPRMGGPDADYHVLFDEVSRRGWRIVLIPTGAMSYVPEAPFTIDSDAPEAIDGAATDMAAFVDQRLAELAYTVEGATDYLSRTHPELAGQSPS